MDNDWKFLNIKEVTQKVIRHKKVRNKIKYIQSEFLGFSSLITKRALNLALELELIALLQSKPYKLSI
jgi:hypothetical protein